MSAFRIARTSVLSAARSATLRNFSAVRINASSPLVRSAFVYRGNAITASRQTRAYSVLTETPVAKLYNYKDVKEIASNPQSYPGSVLVDVREPVEFNDGHIPGALNIPFKSSPGALDLSAEEFRENFGFDKPSPEKELVFYCLGGVRSTAAEELANTFGYTKRGNYVGSWEDWVANENAAEAASKKKQ
ncbi:hypothetical protein G9P44_000772 [Scheffersomyces stipitis]|nr:hypothetical protein G9P44_000772 [Scheffersomyces stipitis]